MGAALQVLPLPPFPQLVGETSKDLYRLALRLTGDPDGWGAQLLVLA